MKTKTSKQPKQFKPAVRLMDIGPKTNPTGAKTTYTNPKTFQSSPLGATNKHVKGGYTSRVRGR